MSGDKDSAEKTEKPTPKRLRDARKKGDVSKSKELTNTVVLLGWLLMLWLAMPFVGSRLASLFNTILDNLNSPFEDYVHIAGAAASETFLMVCALLLGVAVLVGLAIEFMQVGPIFAAEKAKPDVNRLNPVEGIKKMFSQESLVELVKAFFKTVAVVIIFLIIVRYYANDLFKLPTAPVGAFGEAWWRTGALLAGWVIFISFFFSVLDGLFQRFAYLKKLRMSRRDIKRELKDEEGDPYVKARRRQLHQEWATYNLLQAVRASNAVVVNPTHIAVALLYQPGETVVPIVSAKGEDHMAQLIREAAEEAGVPITQNVALARELHERVEIEDYIPVDLFEPVAEVLRWAASIRESNASQEEQERIA